MRFIAYSTLAVAAMIVHGERPTAPTRHQSPVFFAGASRVPREAPGRVALNADGSLDVTRLRWTSWGSRDASGVGVVRWHGCSPDCARASQHVESGELQLSNVRRCHGRSYYSYATVYLGTHERRRQLDWKPLNGYAPC